MAHAATPLRRPIPFPRRPAREEAPITTVYSGIGEHRDDSARLLALGSDGQHYALALSSGAASPVEPDEQWRLDPVHPDREGVLLEPPTP